MKKDKQLLYILSCVIAVLLFSSFFLKLGSSRITAACLLLPLSVATFLLIKRRRALSIEKREVLLLATVISVIYVVLYQMSSLAFGVYKNPYFINTELLLDTVLPLAVIIVTSEIIRYVLLSQNDKFASALSYISCVIAETLMFSGLAGITNFNRFMNLVGMTLFPALTANIYYHFISKRFGVLPNISLRMITTLSTYFIPTTTGMPESLTACVKIIFPIIMLAFMSAMFEKKKRIADKKGKRLGTVGTVVSVLVVTSIAMLVSCQFRFGALVIATESMTGEINKGDMIIYERYDDQIIEEGQVIVFLDGDSKIVHRVVQIECIDGETRYYTKGDANEDKDDGYRVASDIIGLTDIKISFVGYPTLWLRDLIKN